LLAFLVSLAKINGIDMGLPGHRRTKADKRRRSAHFALTAPALTKDKKTGAIHRPHHAAPGATEYRGIKIHVKGHARKLQKLLDKTKSKTVTEAAEKSKAPKEKKPTEKAAKAAKPVTNEKSAGKKATSSNRKMGSK